MNDLQNSIFEAMRLISENTSNYSEKTITIKCQIKEIVDAGIGTYLVEYLNNSFTVFSSNANIQYSVGTNVYVLVPDGDFSQEKIIIGAIKPSADNYVVGDNADNYYDISDNFFEGQIDEIELSSYKTLKPDESKIELTGNNLATVLDGYFKNYDNFEFSFKAKTNLHIDQRVNGNYGATLAIPVKIKDENAEDGWTSLWKKYTLDVGTMIGNPYGLEAWTPQVMNFTIDTTQYFYDTSEVPYITYFCYNFKQDVDKEEIKDIFLKDFCFKVVEALGEEDSQGYKLTLKASGGEYFLKNQTGINKEIKPTLRINGKVTSLKGKPHYWFIENANVYYNHETFVRYGGPGWECINIRENIRTTESGTSVFDYNTKQESININESQLTAPETRIKCAIVYDNKVVSSIITLKDLNETTVIELYPTNGSNIFLKGAGYIELTVDIFDEDISQKNSEEKESVKYIWQRFNQNGILLEDDSNTITVVSNNEVFERDSKLWLKTKIKFPTRLVEGSNTIRCSAFRIGEGTETFIGSKELFISVEQEEGYKLVVENGNKIYKYDADGDSPMIEAYDGPISSRLYGIEALKYRVYKPDGVELTKDEYLQCKYTWIVPKNSMIETTKFYEEDDNYYYFKGKGNETTLSYGIARKFNKLKNDNNIILKVDFQGNLLDNIINLHFIKDGDSGTNGTKYAAVMIMGERGSGLAYGARDAAGRECKLKFYYAADKNAWHWYDHDEIKLFETRPDLNVHVYEDGNLLTPNDYTVKYSMFDERVTNPCFTIDSVTGELKPKDNIDISQDYCNIVQAEITVNKKGNESSVAGHNGTIIYAYYPIEITLANFYSTLMASLDGGFSQVLYGSDGLKPQWDSAEPFVCNLNAINEDIRDEFEIKWNAQYHLHGDADQEGPYGIYTPDEKYDDGNSKNFVKAHISLSEAKAEELNTIAQSLTAQKEQLAIDIKNLDTLYGNLYNENGIVARFNEELWNDRIDILNSIYIDSDGKESPSFFNTRFSAFSLLDSVENYLISIEDYSKEISISEEYKQKYPDKQSDTILTLIGSEYIELKENIQKTKKGLINNNKDNIVGLQKITFNPLSNEKYLLGFGKDSAYYLQDILKILNEFIKGYNNQIELLKSHVQQDNYKELILLLENYYNEISDVAKSLKENLLGYINTFKASSSAIVLKELIIKIQENCFEQFKNNNDILQQSQSKKDEQTKIKIEIGEIDVAIQLRKRYINHIRPIVLLLNRYENSHINNWDGNKIYTGDDDTFLLAPQVGAGKKEDDNSFTGMVMGLRHLNSYSNSQIGLFGYAKGKQSLFLNAENGSAIFGLAGTGQIIIDPSQEGKALLYSSNYFKPDSYDSYTGLPNYSQLNKQGMLIDLGGANIKWGSGDFEVDEKGHITAKGGGTIAKWNIRNTQLFSGTEDKKIITLESTDGDGKIYSHNHDELSDRTKGFYLGKDGISIGDSLLFIEGDSTNKIDPVLKIGKISSSKCWTINGSSTDSYIAYGTDSFNKNSGSVYLGTDGISLGKDKFYVNKDGYLISKDGTIGGWTISSNTLSANDIIISSDGELKGGTSYTWSIKQNGTATFSNIKATGGYIGGWLIDDGNISFGDTELNGTTGKITTNDLYVTGGKIQLGDVIIDENGINVSGSKQSKLGPFGVDGNSIYKGSWSNSTGPTVFICEGSKTSLDIGGSGSRNNWAFGAGGNFGVTADGSLYCYKGKIGSFNFNHSAYQLTYNNGAGDSITLGKTPGSGGVLATFSGTIKCDGLYVSDVLFSSSIPSQIKTLQDDVKALQSAVNALKTSK